MVVGASRGVAHAIQNYTGYSNDLEPRKIVGIFPDREKGNLDTNIWQKEWCNKIGYWDYKM